MRRTKEWWARLTKGERKRLHWLESKGYRVYADECSHCTGPNMGGGQCHLCLRSLSMLIAKADGKLVAT